MAFLMPDDEFGGITDNGSEVVRVCVCIQGACVAFLSDDPYRLLLNG